MGNFLTVAVREADATQCVAGAELNGCVKSSGRVWLCLFGNFQTGIEKIAVMVLFYKKLPVNHRQMR
ncbi:MAG: hypothetical protein Q4A84_10495 [Neisseria sp.]|uniref:hypothetical protein n=1 Tax=Neisseria sp. TaxID=192066 RepID=UPI0026DBF04C|nr:hypothetical protein [Neisseria sp.]MDO4642106.1 hypothetical protein [Neisseria sp.]